MAIPWQIGFSYVVRVKAVDCGILCKTDVASPQLQNFVESSRSLGNFQCFRSVLKFKIQLFCSEIDFLLRKVI